ncbi:hypothetical protein TNCV_4213741 [Trichonephila clavipes]|nr:hypothetical protein TNCV_4213741 [Trichonephila clavipes]
MELTSEQATEAEHVCLKSCKLNVKLLHMKFEQIANTETEEQLEEIENTFETEEQLEATGNTSEKIEQWSYRKPYSKEKY